ncbi:unannotated protein [freshwater metagenome]|uniref:Unannotated protein n=1 Tax=freshwater metagenome TaxID=449393 RepID=A0A6J7MMQ3_9ZZZZ
MHRNAGIRFLTDVPKNIPLTCVKRGLTEFGHIFAERDCEASLFGATTNFFCSKFWIPKRNKCEWNQSTLARTGTPVVNHPIVVNTQTREREIFIGTIKKSLARKSREDVGIVDCSIDVVQIHIGKSRRLIPRAIAKVFVDSRDVALFITRHACGRMQQTRGHN